jgi:hypothetical protein
MTLGKRYVFVAFPYREEHPKRHEANNSRLHTAKGIGATLYN